MTIVTITLKAAFHEPHGKDIEDRIAGELVRYLEDGLEAERAFTIHRRAKSIALPDVEPYSEEYDGAVLTAMDEDAEGDITGQPEAD